MRKEVIGNATLYLGDALTVLATLPDCSVQCCVTSPPYWGLRDYGTEPQIWGGDADCLHDWDGFVRAGLSGGLDNSLEYTSNQLVKPQQQQQCKKCAAWRGNFGLEPTPGMYVEHTVEIFREVRRVLRDNGTLWLNLGDSYTGSGKGGLPEEGKQATNKGSQTIGVLYGKTAETAREAALTNVSRRWTNEQGMAPKNLVGIPWRVAFALQADGWYLRQDIIWAKPNPMPESVRDRCTKAHEYLFLLAKSERYYFDAKAIAEPCVAGDNGSSYTSEYDKATKPGLGAGPRTPKGKALTSPRHDGNTWNENNGRGFIPTSDTRNKRSVWNVPTSPFKEAHFATFPPKLIEPCILAGAPAGGTILDPFNGSGTTGLVALQHGRHYIGIELNPEYLALTVPRIENAQRQERLFA